MFGCNTDTVVLRICFASISLQTVKGRQEHSTSTMKLLTHRTENYNVKAVKTNSFCESDSMAVKSVE